MGTQRIEAHKITKPIQLMAVWFIALLLIDSAFLTATAKITTPTWLAPTLAISAIVFVPLFLGGVFLMQTVFRKELQDDQFYSEWLKRQEETFESFSPENITNNSNASVNISCTYLAPIFNTRPGSRYCHLVATTWKRTVIKWRDRKS